MRMQHFAALDILSLEALFQHVLIAAAPLSSWEKVYISGENAVSCLLITPITVEVISLKTAI